MMTRTETLPAAKRIPRQDFESATHSLANAEAKAQDLVDDAKRDAQRIMADAQTRLRAINDQVKQAERRLLEASAKRTLDDRNSTDALAALKATRDILIEFDKSAPWLLELVSVSLRKIVGDLVPADVLAVTVAQGLKNLKSEHDLILRCATQDFDRVSAIVRDRPDDFEAVSQVRMDVELGVGSVCLDGRGGFVSIGVDAQIDCILREISAACEENTS